MKQVTWPLAFGNVAVACRGTAAARAASTGLTVQQEYGPVLKLPDRGKPEHSERHLSHHQTPHGLPWETTRASMVGSRRILLYVAANHRSTLHIAKCARYSALLTYVPVDNARTVSQKRHCPRRSGTWGSRGMAPPILTLGTL